MSLQASENECAAVAVAPRVSLADIEAAVRYELHVSGREALDTLMRSPLQPGEDPVDGGTLKQLEILSICILVLRNGFMVIGKSAPASPENFNADLGRKLAYEDCIRQLWPLMGFALRDRLAAGAGP